MYKLIVPLLILMSILVCVPADAAETSLLNGPIKNWVVIGPFLNTERNKDSENRGAFDIDYLKPIGGESKARIKPEITVGTGKAKRVKLTSDILDFKKYYPISDNKLAYAYTEVAVTSDKEQFFFLGSDDGAKVWVNGKMVFEVLPPMGRGFTNRENHFTAKLHKGTNNILIKVENVSGDWSLALEAISSSMGHKIAAQQTMERNLNQFRYQELGLASNWPGYVFWNEYGGPPQIVWRDTARVRELVGEMPLKVRWFDSNINEVKKPEKPGRYAAYFEAKLPNGTLMKRAMTFFCAPIEFDPWTNLKLEMPYIGKPVDPEVWKENTELANRTFVDFFTNGLLTTQQGAVFMAAMCEAKPGKSACTTTESPDVINDDFQLAVKLKLMKLDGKTRPLAPPKDRSANPAPVIRQGTSEEAGVSADAKEKIDAICKQWADESGEPLSVLVARHGVIVTHAAFGKDSSGAPLTTDFRTEMASITKALSGVLFGRILDQGYVTLDEPIGNRLPDFPVKGSKMLTYRSLFTHTNGLDGHGQWGGLHNPYLENVILNGLPSLRPGTKHAYNGMGYDLAGKAMEVMTGTSIIRLFHEGLYRPLGINDVPMSDMGYSAQLTSHELGIIGQLLANHGSYGDKEFFSEETFKKLLPEQLSKYYPGIDVEWGIGLIWYREPKIGAPADSKDPKDLIFGKNVIGHGSATSCILRVDLDHDLVIAQVRRTHGPKYDEHLQKFLQVIADTLK